MSHTARNTVPTIPRMTETWARPRLLMADIPASTAFISLLPRYQATGLRAPPQQRRLTMAMIRAAVAPPVCCGTAPGITGGKGGVDIARSTPDGRLRTSDGCVPDCASSLAQLGNDAKGIARRAL